MKRTRLTRVLGFSSEMMWVWRLAGTFLTLSAAVLEAEPYAFTTLAGKAGIYGSGDGTNGNAQFTSPQAVAVDAAGNLYVADNVDSTIRRVALQGTNWVVTTIAGLAGGPGAADGTNSDAQFNQPGGIAVDSAGTIYVADTGNHAVRKVVRGHPNTNWVVTTIAGNAANPGAGDGTNGAAQFNAPTGVAVDSSGNLYVTDAANNNLRKVTLLGTNWVVSTLAGLAGTNHAGSADGTNTQARFNGPTGVAVDGAANVYVSDSLNHTIRRASLLGTNWVVSTLAGLAGSAGSADGVYQAARFNLPAGLAVDAATNFYVADGGNNAIRKGVLSGTNWTVSTVGGLAGLLNYGSSDGFGAGARFWNPQGVAADKLGNLYVVDTWNATLRAGKPAIVLQIVRAGAAAVVSWPLVATNYTLQTSLKVGTGASWSPLTNGVVTNATGYSLTVPIAGTAAFFRLHQ